MLNMKILFSVFFIILAIFLIVHVFGSDRKYDDDKLKKHVILIENSLEFPFLTSAKTVQEALDGEGIRVENEDILFPPGDFHIRNGQHVFLSRRISVIVRLENSERTVSTVLRTPEKILSEQRIRMSEKDFILPGSNIPLSEGDVVKVVRVDIAQEKEYEKIQFSTKTIFDDSVSWRIKKVSERGENGSRELAYTVVRHDGKIVKKTLDKKEIVKKPVEEVVIQGTYVKLGKVHTGLGTWYSFTGTLAAASPWLPIGSYAKVTNTENKKSVIVKINDRGPFGKNRIIDLDKKAFQEIASLGAGVVNVTVEEILN